jgi:hypothetical protein
MFFSESSSASCDAAADVVVWEDGGRGGFETDQKEESAWDLDKDKRCGLGQR